MFSSPLMNSFISLKRSWAKPDWPRRARNDKLASPVQPGRRRGNAYMARWEMSFALERRQKPLFQQIASAVTTDIKRGRLRPGDRLPGTRTLARALGVQRQTVVAAFDEL